MKNLDRSLTHKLWSDIVNRCIIFLKRNKNQVWGARDTHTQTPEKMTIITTTTAAATTTIRALLRQIQMHSKNFKVKRILWLCVCVCLFHLSNNEHSKQTIYVYFHPKYTQTPRKKTQIIDKNQLNDYKKKTPNEAWWERDINTHIRIRVRINSKEKEHRLNSKIRERTEREEEIEKRLFYSARQRVDGVCV